MDDLYLIQYGFCMTIDRLVINLSYLSQRPTGHTVYAQNVIPHLQVLSPIILISEAALPEWKLAHPDLDLRPVPSNMNPDYGRKIDY